jgi:hypothetical protein
MVRTAAMATLGLMLVSGPALANTELVVTGGGGMATELATRGCLDTGPDKCPANQRDGAILIGAGMARVSDLGVRGSLRLEGAFSFGGSRGRQVQMLGAAGWQGRWLMVEGGLGSALLWSAAQHGPGLGGLLHAGVGLRVLPVLSVVARADTAISDDHRPFFLGLAIEWLPLAPRTAR